MAINAATTSTARSLNPAPETYAGSATPPRRIEKHKSDDFRGLIEPVVDSGAERLVPAPETSLGVNTAAPAGGGGEPGA